MLANLLRPLLLDLARALRGSAEPSDRQRAAVAEADEICSAFAERLGMSERERRSDGEWAAVWLQAER